jgi:hypothetical protein
MCFRLFDNVVQMDVGNGHVLRLAGLLRLASDESGLEIQPNPLLRCVFNDFVGHAADHLSPDALSDHSTGPRT